MTEKIRIEQHGYLGLGFWKGAFALVLWPCYLGTALAALPPAG